MVLAPFFATLSAIIPKIQNYFWTQTAENTKGNLTNRLRCIYGTYFICYILKKGNFFYICLYNSAASDKEGFLDQDISYHMG